MIAANASGYFPYTPSIPMLYGLREALSMLAEEGLENVFHRHSYLAGGVRAVLDWELAHLGDPMEDLGWVCVNSWRFGEIDKPVGGLGTREELFAGYEAAGRRVDPHRVMFWEVMGTLRWGLMCCGMMLRFRRSPEYSLERAMIGRRSSETEIDLLRLLAPRAAAKR